VVRLNPTDYFLYLPLLPEVAGGILEPRRVGVSLTGTLPRVRLVLGEAVHTDVEHRLVRYVDPEGRIGELSYDRLVMAVGSVNKLLPIPGVAEHAVGFRGIPEALYLRDHMTRQIELAAAEDDPAECAARCTFVVVGAGYPGSEVAVPGQPEIFACGDAAAVPDPTRPGEITPMTAQHAQRQGRLAARNVAASLGRGTSRPYRHHDLGFVVDLAGAQAAADPFGIPLSGLAAKAVTRGYHLLAVPAGRPRI